jgi:Zn-dependent M28 family amino/carboxypeptidase
MVFVATTAEEAGMLGARYYVDNPVGGLDKTVVNINIDGLGFRQPTNDFNLFPVEGTDVIPTLEQLAAPLGMSFRAEPWHDGMHFSFDTVEFLRRGIVAMTVWQGSDMRGEPEVGTRRGPTHSPRDEYALDSSDPGIEQHMALYRNILEHYAQGAEVPSLTAGHPFGSLDPASDPPR